MEDRIEPTREEQALELLVFLFLIVPSIVLSLFAFGTGQVNFVLLALSTIFRDLALVCLILFFLWRNGETGERIGWTTRDIPANVALGLALSPAVLFGAGLLDALLRFLGLSGPSSLGRALLVPHGSSEILLAFFLVVVVAASEETIFRGYLIARLAGISRSAPLAVIVSSAIFSIGHGYEGTAGLVTVGIMGLVFALLLVWRKSLVAPTIIHFVNDFVGIVLIPLLGGS